MHWTNIGLIIVAALDLGMALFIWLRNWKHKINIFLSAAIFFLAVWTFGSAMYREVESVFWLVNWARMLNISGIVLIVLFFYFSIYFPYQHREILLVEKIIYSSLPLLPLFMLFYPNTWFYIDSIVINPPNNNYQINRLGYLVFVLYFLFYVILAYKNLFGKFKNSGGFVRIQLYYIIIGTGIISFFGTLFGAISPLFFNLDYFWLGPYFGVFMVAILSYFVFRYR